MGEAYLLEGLRLWVGRALRAASRWMRARLGGSWCPKYHTGLRRPGLAVGAAACDRHDVKVRRFQSVRCPMDAAFLR